eukprot:TRINITY_DN11571_c4_g1_i1.p1 TRINITY_DN11571_c4_g1~~TRINITY_DN11571_c4_g1_i1.p1  ORF type:complete len:420 (+),score=62.89 TRINITY_DN11571_c4_g1_i1:109-1260(+)
MEGGQGLTAAPSLTKEEVASASQVVLQPMQTLGPQLGVRMVQMPVMVTVPQPMGIINGMNMNLNLFGLQQQIQQAHPVQVQQAQAATPAQPATPSSGASAQSLFSIAPSESSTASSSKPTMKQLLPTNEVSQTVIRTLRNNDPSSTFLIADDAEVSTPTMELGKVPFAGSFVGKSGMMELTRKLHGDWQLLEIEEKEVAQSNKTIFMTVYFKIRSPTGSMYSSFDPVIIMYNGKCITSVKIYFTTPEMLEVAYYEGIVGEKQREESGDFTSAEIAALESRKAGRVQQQRLVPQESPCGHNSWDNVRIKKGDITFRCRICQSQWRTEVANSTRCADFQAGHCDKGSSCPSLHVHAHKQSLSQRLSQFGGTVLERVPIHQWSTPS